ncbi:MAG: hypothetical protein H7258_00605 [Ferruginibacter sp.]|nr:hypothetical protein [Ferruginibacter sp.]
MKKLILLVVITTMLISCDQPLPAAAIIVKSPVDSLITNWSNTWNNHDSAGVRNMFVGDALVIDDNLVASGQEEISSKWIHPNINAVNHFKTTHLQDWYGNERAGYTGRYEFYVMVNDSVVAKPRGIYTVNWIKTDKGAWKITTAVIHSLTETK